jgi:predicted Holliday junction resolvase-like endonuclease
MKKSYAMSAILFESRQDSKCIRSRASAVVCILIEWAPSLYLCRVFSTRKRHRLLEIMRRANDLTNIEASLKESIEADKRAKAARLAAAEEAERREKEARRAAVAASAAAASATVAAGKAVSS